jgi:hypothetical protein
VQLVVIVTATPDATPFSIWCTITFLASALPHSLALVEILCSFCAVEVLFFALGLSGLLAAVSSFCNEVVVDERTLCSAVNNSVRQVGIR